ncbi:MAG: hypothetical protein LYZ69_05405 [Nitrososphaerales archaeon]|nr:hypothetical protein [Nitrososphaerales archaeon]
MTDKQEEEATDWSGYSCPNASCRDHGVAGRGNIRLERRYGRNSVALLRCKTCMKTFSENRGTPLFRLRLPYEKFREVLTSLVRCGSIRGTADTVGVNKNTVERIVKLAGKHMKRFNDFMLRNLRMSQVQCDEFWTYIASKRGVRMTKARGTSP